MTVASEKANTELAKGEAAWFWTRRRRTFNPATCNVGPEHGPVTEGVHKNGSFNLEAMLTGLVSKAQQMASCLQQHRANRQDIKKATFKVKILHKIAKLMAPSITSHMANAVGANRQDIKKATFKVKILHKIAKLMAPSITSHMANADFGLDSLVHQGSQSIANLSANGIQTIEWLEHILRTKVTLAVNNEAKNITTSVMGRVWSACGNVVQDIDRVLVWGLRLIPIIGGELAEAASKQVSEVYNRVKEGVNAAIFNLIDRIANETTNAIVNEAITLLDEVKAGIKNVSDVIINNANKLEDAGKAVADAIGNATKAEYAKQAEAANRSAAGQHAAIIADGHEAAN
eukprot:CAMPEP_0169412474 /NCGR_PEP_ID=MMETSP1017-20121227/60839_1 /TAXON_ID=342587 /ORGANISM="Karlodinium micrum, Strain CCMP2283" /LENGTH=344 /DNA_ID=CAMNT_0009519819 /DNA_START=184 /DNA_END=1218 /DNA_ORIENTATION=-